MLVDPSQTIIRIGPDVRGRVYTKDEDGKQVLTAESKALMFGQTNNDSVTKHGLRYDLKTDMFVPINPEDKKWKQ